MPVVGEAVGRDVEVFALEQLEETLAVRKQRRRPRCGHRLAVALHGEQHAGFLEALAHRGDVVREAPGRQAEALAGLHIAEADRAVRGGVRGIERPPRKDVGAAQERGALRALKHERFEPARAFAQQDKGRCRPRQVGSHLDD